MTCPSDIKVILKKQRYVWCDFDAKMHCSKLYQSDFKVTIIILI
jgi:hypothetical protein